MKTVHTKYLPSSSPSFGTGIRLLCWLGLWLLATALQAAPFAYTANQGSNTVSVIDVATAAVVKTLPVGATPTRIAISPDGKRAYVTNQGSNSVSVIDTASNTVLANPIPVGRFPFGIAITPNGAKAYVVNIGDNTVSAINLASGTVTGNAIPVGRQPQMIAISPDGKRAYVVNTHSNTVSVIDTAIDTVVGNPISVGRQPFPLTVAPDGKHVYVANFDDNTISVIDTASNAVVGVPIIDGIGLKDLTITPDGKKLYGTGISTFIAVDLAQNNSVTTTSLPSISNYALALPPDVGQVWVTGTATNGFTVFVIDTRNNTVAATIPGIGSTPAGIGSTPAGIAIMPFPRFSAFNANLTAKQRSKPNTDSFTLAASFTLANGSAPLNLARDNLKLRVGDFEYTIPAGAWGLMPGTNNKWGFGVAVLEGLKVQATLERNSASVYTLNLAANTNPHGTNINLVLGKNFGQLPLQ
jgi:YVTN family beta-propeller protein